MQKIKFKIVLTLCFCTAIAQAQTQIYRSVGPGWSSALSTGTGNNLTVSGSTATFATALPDTVGIGHGIQYDSDGNGSIDAICFITARASATSFTVKTATGGTPTAVTNDQDWSIFAAYTSLANFYNVDENDAFADAVENFDAAQRDIDANSENWNVICYRGIDTSQLIFATAGLWKTSATETINIYTPTASTEVGISQKHYGSWSLSGYILQPSAAGAAIEVQASNVDHLKIQGLQIHLTDTLATDAIKIAGGSASANFKIYKCILHGRANAATGATHYGISITNDAAGAKYRITNNIIYGFITGSTALDGGIYADTGLNGTIYANNNTAYGNAPSDYIRSGGTFIAKNNISLNASDGWSGSFDAASNYNVSVQADAPGANSLNSTTIAFVEPASGFFELKKTDAAVNAGTDLSGDTEAVTDDAVEVTRFAPYDMGALEYRELNFLNEPVAATVLPTSGASMNQAGIGMTFTGTITPLYTATGYATNFVTSAAAGNIAGLVETVPSYFRGSTAGEGGFTLFARLKFPDGSYASTRFFCGFGNKAPSVTLAGDNPSGHYAGFQFSTARGDVYVQFMTKDGTTQTVASTAVAFTAGKIYEFWLRCPKAGSTISWQINNVTDGITNTGEAAANLPGASTIIAPTIALNNVSATVRNFTMLAVKLGK